MTTRIQKFDHYSLATIEESTANTVTALITADIHSETTTEGEALHYLAPEALLAGTTRYTREEILNKINLLGASIEMSITNGQFTVVIKSRQENFARVASLFQEILASPSFKKTELDRIKLVAKNELHQAKEDSRAVALTELRNQIYGQADRRHESTPQSVINALTKVTQANLKQLHQTILSTYWTVSVSGRPQNITKFTKEIDQLKSIAKTCQPLVSTHQQLKPRPGLKLFDIPSRSNIDFSIGAPIPITLHHPDYLPLVLGLNVLGKWGGFSGRLMSTVREKEGLTYGIYCGLETIYGDEAGYWRIMTFFSPEKSTQGISSTFREVTKLFEKGITTAELERFKVIMFTKQALVNDSVTGRLQDLHAYHTQGFSIQEMAEHKQKIATITKKEVNNAIQKYLNPNQLTVCGAGPTKRVQKELKELLSSMS
jgi:zinc protease